MPQTLAPGRERQKGAVIDTIPSAELEAYADVVLRIGSNVQPGQTVVAQGLVEHAPLLRALAERAYAHGAGAAYVYYRDKRIIRSQLVHAANDVLAERIEPWAKAVFDAAVEEGAATIGITGDNEDDVYEGAEPHRVSAWWANWFDQSFRVEECGLSWTIVACPVPGWAARVYGEPDLAPLWRDLGHIMRLDEPDPVAAWETRLDELVAQAARLDKAAFKALRFKGGNTDLLVPLHPDSRWLAGWAKTREGRRFCPNLPTEEIFTTPDWRGVEGTAATTRPVLVNGVKVDGLVVRFEAGRMVDVQARTGVEAVRAQIEVDDGARRLGEVSLVDASSRIGQLGRVFKDTLLDENAACHIAWGVSLWETMGGDLPAGDEERVARGVNMSRVHQDVMIGGRDVDVLGITAGGSEAPVLIGERWHI